LRQHVPTIEETDRGGVSLAARAAEPTSSMPAAPQLARLAALQRSAGNRAVVQLLRHGPPGPSIQRCGPGGCAESPAGGEEEAAAAQGVEGIEDESVPLQRSVQRAADGVGPRPVVQRVATWAAAGAVHQVNNLAAAVMNGTEVGVTWPTLNGTQFWSSPVVRGALHRPTLKTTAAAAGGGFDAEVDVVADNTGSFDETVLAAGPWRINVPKATVRARVPAIAGCGGAGNSRFRAFGDPSDNAMFTANRRHEDHHRDDHQAAFNATIGAWDTKLSDAKAHGTKFHGATAADAEAALWAAVGGTPDQIADAYFNQCAAAVVAYHATAAGGPVQAPTHPGSRNHCAISWAKYKNPS
jgi:hypothetical protein